MTPTLEGRLQTRIFLAATVGVLWTAVIVPFLPEPAGVSVGMAYFMAFGSLLVMTVYGLVWEHLYHALQQLRWDKDWPSAFALLSVLAEAPLVWLLDQLFPVMSGSMGSMPGSAALMSGSAGLASPYFAGFAVHIGTTWTVMWLFSQGPMRVICVRWRFEGGRVVNSRLPDAPLPADRLEIPGPEGNGGAGPRSTEAALSAAGTGLTVYPGSGLAQPNGTPATASADLVEGVTCGQGHFGYPGMRYCMVCGVSLLPLTGRLGPGRRPPLGVLIFADGATHVVDRDLRLAQAEGPGNLTAGRRDDIPADSALAEIRLTGWQPVVSSEFCPIAVALPGGGHLDVAPGAPAPLMAGAEFTVGRHRIRYESPYQPADLDLAALGPRIRAGRWTGAATSLAAETPPPSGQPACSAHPQRPTGPSGLGRPAPREQPTAAPDLPAAPGHSDAAPAPGLKTYSITSRREPP